MANIRHHTLFWRATLGLLGALMAWGAGEIPRRWSQTSLADFSVYSTAAEKVGQAVREGELPSADGVEAMNKLNRAHAGNPYVKIASNRSYSPREKAYRIERLRSADLARSRIGPLIWYSAVGVILALVASTADALAAGNMRSAVIHAAVGVLLGLVGAVAVCLFISEPYRTIPASPEEGASMAGQILGRSAAWAVLGLFVAVAPGILLRNGKRLAIGLAAGAAGGLAGGALFAPVLLVSHNEIAARLAALVAFGAVTGLVTSLLEETAKTAWLRVVAGPFVGRQFVLYRDPTCIGRSSRGEIYLRRDPQIDPRHAAIRLVPGGYEIEDLHTGKGTLVNGKPIDHTHLTDGDQIQIGSTGLQFRQKTRSGSDG